MLKIEIMMKTLSYSWEFKFFNKDSKRENKNYKHRFLFKCYGNESRLSIGTGRGGGRTTTACY
jgi:hypothetical protein